MRDRDTVDGCSEAHDLLAHRPAAFGGHVATFFTGTGNRPNRTRELAMASLQRRGTPRSGKLVAKPQHAVPANEGAK